MIAFLEGILAESLPTQIVVNVHGVGYQVLIPISSFERLPQVGSPVKILTHLAVREDAHTLYGFLTPAERDLFRLLVHTVSGIGPKIALAILSGLSVHAFRSAVLAQDVKALSSVSGVGRKTAERIVVELKDKVGDAGLGAPAAAGPVRGTGACVDARLGDAAAALAALGVKPADAHEAVRAATAMLGDGASVEQIVRACLKRPA